MSILFDPGQIGNMRLENRLVRSPTGDGGMASADGKCTDMLIDFYRELVEGGVGLIITGGAFVHRNDRRPYNIWFDNDDAMNSFIRFTNEIHACNGKVVIQLASAGREISWLDGESGGPIGPSPVKVDYTGLIPREMTEDDIQEFINAFSHAAQRAREVGFDGVEFHACHGSFLHSFLSPYTNRRRDKWGGSFENSMRFLLEMYEKTRELVGDDYPILIKCNAHDYFEGGITIDLSKRIAERISAVGFDAIEISAGTHTESMFYIARGDIPTNYNIVGARADEKKSRKALSLQFKAMINEVKFKEAYLRPFAREIKKVIDIPLILPGGLRTVSIMEDILEKGDADFIGLCRPLIRDPYLPNGIKRGLKKSDCLNCNWCLIGYQYEHPKLLQCYQKLFHPPHY
jgi:2,4-dienoyl-CoA reductase-like NADH-dependent reductase (Old Yellow Enzyme family)